MGYSQALTNSLSPTVFGLGYELLGVETATSAGGTLVRFFIDKESGITVEDCERVSRQVGDVIEAEQILRGEYTLEVSSPGIERPLFTVAHFEQYLGATVDVKLANLVNGRRKISGEIVAVTSEIISIDDASERYEIPFRLIDRARLVHKWNG